MAKPIPITSKNMPEIEEALRVCIESDKKTYQVAITVFDNSLHARQRALSQIWYSQIDDDMAESSGWAEAYCKLQWGLRIRCVYDPSLKEFIGRMLQGRDYEQKIEIIRCHPEFFPVLRATGGLCVEGQARYLNCIQKNFAEQGVILRSKNQDELLSCKEANR